VIVSGGSRTTEKLDVSYYQSTFCISSFLDIIVINHFI